MGVKTCKRCGETKLIAEFGKETKRPDGQADAVVKKAIVIGANILMGKGKKDFLVRLISEALNTPCPYCGVELTLENISLDHKEAYGSTELRRNKKENKELRAKMDRKENLHLVCKECNTLKMDMDHEDYLEFLKFFDGRQKAMNSVFRRLKMSVNPYRRR